MAIYKLGEIADLKSGNTPSRNNKNYWINGDIKWLTSGEIKPNTSNTKEKINSSFFKGPIFDKGCPIIAMYGVTAGKVGYLGDSMAVNQAICVCKAKKNLINNKYLYLLLEKESDDLKKFSYGAAQQNLSIKTISNYKVDMPNMNSQKQIIDIIEPIEDLEKIISDLLEISEKFFTYRKFSNKLIKKNITWKSSGYAYKRNEKIIDGKYKIFTIKNINDKNKFEKTNIIKNNLINRGDVITGLSGTIGSAGINFENNWVSNQRTLVLSSKFFLNIKISIELQKYYLLKQATGAVQKNITVEDILNLKMIEINYELDEKINKAYLNLLNLKNNLSNIKNKLITLLIK